MGFDLKPVRDMRPGDYNVLGWSWLREFLAHCGQQDLANRLPTVNEGELISYEDCQRIYVAMRDNKDLYVQMVTPFEWRYREMLTFWQQCGGCYVY